MKFDFLTWKKPVLGNEVLIGTLHSLLYDDGIRPRFYYIVFHS
jgi:hypothetical protein